MTFSSNSEDSEDEDETNIEDQGPKKRRNQMFEEERDKTVERQKTMWL